MNMFAQGSFPRFAQALFAAACCLIACGCETLTDPDDVPYVDRLVIEGVLTADSAVRSIRITHTLPLDRPYSEQERYVENLPGTIVTPAGRFPLVYAGRGFYDAPGAVVRAGEICRIETSWKGEPVTAQTRIPNRPVITHVTFEGQVAEDTLFILRSYLVRMVSVDVNAVYGHAIITPPPFADGRHPGWDRYGSYGVRPAADTASDGAFLISEQDVYAFCKRDSAYLEIAAYDAPYYDFIKSYTESDDDGGIFGSLQTTRWNVEGNGIGIFVGKNAVRAKVEE